MFVTRKRQKTKTSRYLSNWTAAFTKVSAARCPSMEGTFAVGMVFASSHSRVCSRFSHLLHSGQIVSKCHSHFTGYASHPNPQSSERAPYKWSYCYNISLPRCPRMPSASRRAKTTDSSTQPRTSPRQYSVREETTRRNPVGRRNENNQSKTENRKHKRKKKLHITSQAENLTNPKQKKNKDGTNRREDGPMDEGKDGVEID